MVDGKSLESENFAGLQILERFPGSLHHFWAYSDVVFMTVRQHLLGRSSKPRKIGVVILFDENDFGESTHTTWRHRVWGWGKMTWF